MITLGGAVASTMFGQASPSARLPLRQVWPLQPCT